MENTPILEPCNGIIRDGLCTKCYSRQTSTSIHCTQVYEVIPVLSTKLSPEVERYLKYIDEIKDYILKNC